MLLRRAGLTASAGLSCIKDYDDGCGRKKIENHCQNCSDFGMLWSCVPNSSCDRSCGALSNLYGWPQRFRNVLLSTIPAICLDFLSCCHSFSCTSRTRLANFCINSDR